MTFDPESRTLKTIGSDGELRLRREGTVLSIEFFVAPALQEPKKAGMIECDIARMEAALSSTGIEHFLTDSCTLAVSVSPRRVWLIYIVRSGGVQGSCVVSRDKFIEAIESLRGAEGSG